MKVVTYDADTMPNARTIFVSLPDFKSVGEAQIEWLGSQIGYKGEFAILSATAVAPNQNQWIRYMKLAIKKPKYKNMKLVKVAYGNDNDTKSAQEAQALLQAYPEPEGDHLADDRRHRRRGTRAHSRPGSATSASRASGCRARCGRTSSPAASRSSVSGTSSISATWRCRPRTPCSTGRSPGPAGQSYRAGSAGTRSVGSKGVVIGVPPFAFTKANIDKFKF